MTCHATLALFDAERLGPCAIVLRRAALGDEDTLLHDLSQVIARAAFRHMHTPGGSRMSVAMTNCGEVGWLTDRSGYHYATVDPETGRRWPSMPRSMSHLAQATAARAGFPNFVPDACLINRYVPGARMGLHRDNDEHDFSHPIVSVSLGLSAVFMFGGATRSERALRVRLDHGDVVVWGGPDRLRYHGVMPIREGQHPTLGRSRINLTFRKACVGP